MWDEDVGWRAHLFHNNCGLESPHAFIINVGWRAPFGFMTHVGWRALLFHDSCGLESPRAFIINVG